MKIKLFLTVGLLSLITCSALHAEDKTKKNFETITVTANKVEESIQDVPQSITVIDNTIIEEKGIKSVEDVIREIPNMTGIPDPGMAINFRGLNASMFTSNNPVVVYIDGIPSTGIKGFNVSMVNVERIEVLRGPQGTLYGKDAIGAVINIITKDSQNKTVGSVGAEYGNNNYIQGRFNISTPLITNQLYFGLNGELNKDDGWITNDYNGDDKAAQDKEYSLSAFLKYNVNDRLSTKLVLNKDYVKKDFIKGYVLAGGTDIGEFKRDDAEHANFEMPAYEKEKVDSQSLSVKYLADFFTFNSITTHRKVDTEATYDADFSNTALQMGLSHFDETKMDTYTQELRFTSNNIEGIRWVGGVYIDMEEVKKGPYGTEFPNFHPITHAYLGNYYMDAHSKTDSNTLALFGQTMIPMGEKFELTLGGRLQKITKEIEIDTYYLPVGTSGSPMYSLEDKKSWNTFLPKLALSYKLNENYTPYVSVSKGYMPGGYNYFVTSGTAEDNSFDPQQSTNYEVGIKGVINNLSFSAAIFRMDIKDIHVYKSVGTGIYLADNADKAHSQGIELDFNYFPTDTIEISGAVGFIDAKYDSYDAGTHNFDGEKIETTPSHTASLSFAYHHPVGYYGRFDIKNQGKMTFYDDEGKKFVKESGYTTADMKIGYKISDWNIYAYVNNITDEEYIDTFKSNQSMAMATFGDPRTFGLGFKYDF